MPAGTLGAELGLAPATLSFHLKELRHAGLIRQQRAGRTIYYAADYAAMNGLIAYLTENCCQGAVCIPTAGGKPLKSGRPARKPKAGRHA